MKKKKQLSSLCIQDFLSTTDFQGSTTLQIRGYRFIPFASDFLSSPNVHTWCSILCTPAKQIKKLTFT